MNIVSLSLQVEGWPWLKYPIKMLPVIDDDEDNDLNIDEDDFCFEQQSQ